MVNFFVKFIFFFSFDICFFLVWLGNVDDNLMFFIESNGWEYACVVVIIRIVALGMVIGVYFFLLGFYFFMCIVGENNCIFFFCEMKIVNKWFLLLLFNRNYSILKLKWIFRNYLFVYSR